MCSRCRCGADVAGWLSKNEAELANCALGATAWTQCRFRKTSGRLTCRTAPENQGATTDRFTVIADRK